MVKVKLFANFREVAGKKEVEIDADSLEDLLVKLTEMFPKLKEMFFEGGKLRDYVHIMVGGKNIRGLKGLKTRLNENDVVAIFPPVSGG